MLSCISCLYILDINPRSIISFANILSHSVGCLFVLSMVSFPMQKLLSLISSQSILFHNEYPVSNIEIIFHFVEIKAVAFIDSPFLSQPNQLTVMVLQVVSHIKIHHKL